MVPIDTPTQWGKVAAIRFADGERYYFLVDKHGMVSMMPACVVEPSIKPTPGAGRR